MEVYFYIIMCPVAFCLLDVLTGYAAAMRNGTLNSSVMRKGLWNKTAEILAILAAVLTQMGVYVYGNSFLDVQLDVPIITIICGCLSLYELTSVVENLGKMNKDIAEILIKTLGIDPEKVGLEVKTDD